MESYVGLPTIINQLQEQVSDQSFNGFDVDKSKEIVEMLASVNKQGEDIVTTISKKLDTSIDLTNKAISLAEKYQSELYDLECGLWTMGFFKRLKYLFNPYFISHEQFKGLSNKEISAYEESASK